MEKAGQNNLYESITTPEEKRRLEELGYPAIVSERVLGHDLKDKRILDVGSGPSTALGEYVRAQSGDYIAFDIQKSFLESQQAGGNDTIQGRLEQLPFKDGSTDVVHERFVLMHLSPEARKQAIAEIIKTSKERAIFLEYDWNTFHGSEVVNQARDFALRFLQSRSDPFLGEHLRAEIEDVVKDMASMDADIQERKFQEGPGAYYQEIISLMTAIRSNIPVAEEGLIREADEIIARIKTESEKEKPELFTRPDVVSVEVLLKRHSS